MLMYHPSIHVSLNLKILRPFHTFILKSTNNLKLLKILKNKIIFRCSLNFRETAGNSDTYLYKSMTIT